MKKYITFKRYATVLFFLFMVNFPAYGQPNALRSITGTWKTEDGDGVVEFYPCDQKICGRFHWLKKDSPEHPSLDDKNPDPEQRTRHLCEMSFMGGFTPQGEGRFTDGWIYSPHDGGTYSGNLTLKNSDTVELRGFVFIPLFGETQVWKRTGSDPVCITSHPQ
jgi:uncharacterized protein (DUF2147 family)